MVPRRLLEQSGFALLIALSRFAFRSRFLYDIDSVNFALGILRFDPRTYQAHPPGYFLYIMFGRLINSAVHDANLALVLLSIAASCGTVVLIYQMGFEWFGKREARFAGLLFLFSPLAWFHGTVALTYSLEAFFSVLIGYLCWRVSCGDLRWVIPAGVVLGISAGVRPSSILLLAPLYLFSLRVVPRKVAVLGVGAVSVTVLAWFAPMIHASGGFSVYRDALLSLWRLVPGRDTVFNSSPATSIARGFTVGLIFFLTFGTACVGLAGLVRNRHSLNPEKMRFTLVWVSPAMCFYVFMFLKFVNSGYLLILIAPGCLWLGHSLADWFTGQSVARTTKLGIVSVAAVVNIGIFIGSPFYCSYRSVRKFEGELSEVTEATRRIGRPADIVIVGFDSHFLGYRHAGYYLPEYQTLQYPQVNLLEGPRIFTMHNQDTRLAGTPSTGGVNRFLLFPLPADDAANSAYLKKVEQLLPADSLQTLHIGNHLYVTGPIEDLPLLFPATPGVAAGVYPPLHSDSQDVNRREQFGKSRP